MRDPTTQDSAPRFAIGRLRHRADFLRAARGKRWHAPGMTVQVAAGDDATAVRIGYTLTRKVGGAVIRNRIRRRLKEAVRISTGLLVEAGHDYVIIGRVEALRMPFETLTRNLEGAVLAAHQAGRSNRSQSRSKRPTGTKPAP